MRHSNYPPGVTGTEPQITGETTVFSDPLHEPDRVYASKRAETQPCQRGTVGCSIDHEAERELLGTLDSSCETW